MSGSIDPRLMAILQQYAPQYASQMPGAGAALGSPGPSPYDIPPSTAANFDASTAPGAGFRGASRNAPIAPVAPGTPYGGPAPPVAGAYNTLSPNNYAAYQASQQPQDPNWQPPPQQQLPGLLDDNAAQVAQAKKLFDNPNGYWSGGEGSGGNGGGQR